MNAAGDGEYPEPDAAEMKLLVGRFVLTVCLLMLTLGALGLAFGEPLLAGSRAFVDTFGVWGVMLGFGAADAFPVPIPHDVITAAGVLGGLPFWTVVLWASLGSFGGASVGFAIGRYLSHTAWFERIMARRGAAARRLAERYGMHALVLGALTPLNYCIVVWATGALNLSWRKFWLVTWLRVPRVIFYLWLFKIGLIDPIS